MKAITLIIAMITVLVFNTNAQNTDVKELLDNKETRTELFNAIASDHQMMMDFIKVAKKNEHGAMMMRDAENPEMKKMGSMQDDNKKQKKMESMQGGNDEQKMMGMMKNNPEMMQKMMGNMMEMCKKDSAMRNKMANMMSENPEMMKMCMQKMKEKGMMNSDGKMMDKKGKSNQENHNH